ncbi:hypothetical protein HBN50_03615 [Halobacteriovorax sp. GB3]|uniref:hypothetical protein n=1 Tax=Halobacteriovorax sp. GB3 TaxID=2719615 RepID=UPI00236143EF|nr:hypothetical protein [Halobacteriovorax sp. GB3]MDD0852166.1 hypothetical protein [Halobacteriovorax sp. GB3]
MKTIILSTLLLSNAVFAADQFDVDKFRQRMKAAKEKKSETKVSKENVVESTYTTLFTKEKNSKKDPSRKDGLTPLQVRRDGNIFLRKSGFSSGGGGNSVVCFDERDQISEINLLDYFEGLRKDSRSNVKIDLPGNSVEEKLKLAFRRMEKHYPSLASKLRNRALWILDRMDYYLISTDDGKLSPIYDMDLPFVPSKNEQGQNCEIIRFAVQLTKQVEGQKKFYFVRELYDHPKTSLSTKAGIILHEVLYEEAIKTGATDSDFVRWMTYLLSTSTFETMSSEEILDLENSPGAEFLSGFGVEYNNNQSRTQFRGVDDLRSRDDVFILNNYTMVTKENSYKCFDHGLCQLFKGEYLGKDRRSSSLFPKVTIMLEKTTIKATEDISFNKVKGEVWNGYASKVATRLKDKCHSNGGCIGDLVGVFMQTKSSVVSYTGIIAGIFPDGDFAIRLIDGRFEIFGSNVNPFEFSSRDQDIYLFAKGDTVSLID